MKKLHIVFATLNPDFTWIPRRQIVKVEDIYAQNQSQTKETANLWAGSDEVVFSVVSENIKEPRLYFRAIRKFEINGTRFDHYVEEEYSETVEPGQMVNVKTSPKGFVLSDDSSMVLAYRSPDCDGYEYTGGFIDKNNLECIYYDENDNEVVVPMPF